MTVIGAAAANTMNTTAITPSRDWAKEAVTALVAPAGLLTENSRGEGKGFVDGRSGTGVLVKPEQRRCR
jgi:hypothetical protein